MRDRESERVRGGKPKERVVNSLSKAVLGSITVDRSPSCSAQLKNTCVFVQPCAVHVGSHAHWRVAAQIVLECTLLTLVVVVVVER